MVGRTGYKQQINLLELSKEELTKKEIKRNVLRRNDK